MTITMNNTTMARAWALVLSLMLAGCSNLASYQQAASACTLGEASFECQIERYHNVNAP